MTTCLYIASPSFSGSTLLTMLLGGHRQIATIGELKGGQEDMATYGCACGELFARCPFWQELIARLKDRGFVYDLSDRRTMPAFNMPDSFLGDKFIRCAFGSRHFEFVRDFMLAFWPGCKSRVEHVRRYTQAFIDVLFELTGGNVFVDSSKDPVRIKYLAAMPGLQLKVVHLVRDGRGVANSSRKNMRMTIEAAASEWSATQAEIERVTARFCPGRVLRVRYEDLCAEPERVVGRILEFIGVHGPYHINEAAEREQHVLGNRMRLRGVLPIKLDESWREQLSPDDLSAFERVAGRTNQMYGYGSDRGQLSGVR